MKGKTQGLLKTVAVVSGLLFAFGILFISILRVAAVKYSFRPIYADDSEIEEKIKQVSGITIDYSLAYPGSVLPDHPLWFLKAGRDKVWLFLTTDTLRKSDLNLLFADKRLQAAKKLFEEKKTDLGFSTLVRAEKYLENASNLETKARSEGYDTFESAQTLALAALKHRQTIKYIIAIAPEEARPEISKVEEYPISVYKDKEFHLINNKYDVVKNPFDGQ